MIILYNKIYKKYKVYLKIKINYNNYILIILNKDVIRFLVIQNKIKKQFFLIKAIVIIRLN